MGSVLFCADESVLRNPEAIGMKGARLDKIPWLVCKSEAQECRDAVSGSAGFSEIIVVDAEDMEGINLAAALKSDAGETPVFLVSNDSGGSLASRAKSAKIDGLVTTSALPKKMNELSRANAEAMLRVPEVEPFGVGAIKKAPGSDQMASKQGTVVCFVGGSGGCGKSALSVVAALVCSAAGLSTVLVDADLQFGDAHLLLGRNKPLRMDEAVDNPSTLSRLESEAKPGMVSLVAAPERIEQADALSGRLDFVLSKLKERYDVVIVNTGAFWSDVQATFLESCDQTIMVLEPRASSLFSTVHAVGLCSRLGVATNAFAFALNKQTKDQPLSVLDVSSSLKSKRVFEIPDGGREVEELLSAGMAKEFLSSRNAMTAGVSALLREVLPEEKSRALRKGASPAKKKFGLFSKGARS